MKIFSLTYFELLKTFYHQNQQNIVNRLDIFETECQITLFVYLVYVYRIPQSKSYNTNNIEVSLLIVSLW